MTLKELVINFGCRLTDGEIIKRYFIENNLESEAISMITDLAKSQTAKVQKQLEYAQSWVPTLSYPLGVKNDDVKQVLMRIAAYHMVSRDLPDDLITWAKENIPKMKIPTLYFMPAVEWLDKKYGIKFMDDTDGK